LKNNRGFTLTELAIVLSIMGIILGAVWAAASTVYINNALKTAVTEQGIIAENYRSMFSAHGVDTGEWIDITCAGINNGYFPTAMLVPGTTCASSAPGTGPTHYPASPFGGSSYVVVYSVQSMQGIVVAFFGLTQAQCSQYANQVMSIPGLIYEQIDSTGQELPPWAATTPYTTAQANAACNAAGAANAVYIMYPAR
jgi:prepilin-type N-terminal cleavage/methylation domain-containing protein